MAEEIITETNRETATDHAYGGAFWRDVLLLRIC